jgi:holo-[acyl-carrier protein] synthase
VAQPANSSRFRIGVDLVGVERVARLVTDHEGALDELFTEREQAHWRRKRQRYQHLAGRFAAKEAVLKAFGTGLRQRMRWTDVEIISGTGGRPEVLLHGEVAE